MEEHAPHEQHLSRERLRFLLPNLQKHLLLALADLDLTYGPSDLPRLSLDLEPDPIVQRLARARARPNCSLAEPVQSLERLVSGLGRSRLDAADRAREDRDRRLGVVGRRGATERSPSCDKRHNNASALSRHQ